MLINHWVGPYHITGSIQITEWGYHINDLVHIISLCGVKTYHWVGTHHWVGAISLSGAISYHKLEPYHITDRTISPRRALLFHWLSGAILLNGGHIISISGSISCHSVGPCHINEGGHIIFTEWGHHWVAPCRITDLGSYHATKRCHVILLSGAISYHWVGSFITDYIVVAQQ